MPHRHLSGFLPGAPPPSTPKPPSKRSSSRPSTSEGLTLPNLRRRSIDWYSLRLGSAPPTPPTSPEHPAPVGSAALNASLGLTLTTSSPTGPPPPPSSRRPTSPLTSLPSTKPFRMPSLGNMARHSGLSRFTRRSTASSERIGAGAKEAAQQNQRERDTFPQPSPSGLSHGLSSASTLPRREPASTPSLRSARHVDREPERRASSVALFHIVDRDRHGTPQTIDSPTHRTFKDRYGDISRPPSRDEPFQRLNQRPSQTELSSPSPNRSSARLPRLGRRPKTAENRIPAKFGMSEVVTSPNRLNSPRPRTNTVASSGCSPRMGDGTGEPWLENARLSPSGSFATATLSNAHDSPPGASLRSRLSLNQDPSTPSGSHSSNGHSPKEPRILSPQLSLSGFPSAGFGLGITFNGSSNRDDESSITVRSATDLQVLHRGSSERLGSVECFGDSYAKQFSLPKASGLPQSGLTPPPRPKRKIKGQGHRRGDSNASSSMRSSWSNYTKVEEPKTHNGRQCGHHRVQLSIADSDSWAGASLSAHSRSSSSSSSSAVTRPASGPRDAKASTQERRPTRKTPPAPLRLSPLSEDDLSLHRGSAYNGPSQPPTPSPTMRTAGLKERHPKPTLLLPVSPPLSPSVTTDVAIAYANQGLRERIEQLKSNRQREKDLRDAGLPHDVEALARGVSPKPRLSLNSLVHPISASPAASASVSLPNNEGAADGDDLEDYWSMESNSFERPSSLSLGTSPSSMTEYSSRHASPCFRPVAPLSQPVAPVPPRGLIEAGFSEEEALKARLRWVNDQITEACRIIAMAAKCFVSDDGMPPNLESARGARTFSILRDPRLASLEPERRHHYLDELLLHLVLSTLQRELCEPFCYGYSREDTIHATRLMNMVWSQTPAEAATVQRTLHRSMRQSLANHLRSAFRSNVRAKLQGSIGLLFAWCGLVARPSDSNLHIAKGHAALKAAIEELALIIDDAREAGATDGEKGSPEFPAVLLPSTTTTRLSTSSNVLTPTPANIKDPLGLPVNLRAAESGVYDICLADERQGKGLVVAKGLGITQRTSSSAHRVALLPRWTVILDP